MLSKVKTGEDSVTDIAKSYGIPHKYIYNWLSSPINKDPYVLKINRLEREKRELLEIIGELTTEVKREKKHEVMAKTKLTKKKNWQRS